MKHFLGTQHGDPHITTLDGYSYTFNGHGEFTMIESVDEFLKVQVRLTEPPVSSNDSNITLAGSGTVISAIVAKQQDSDTVQFEMVNGELIALVNGDIIDFDTVSEQQFQNLTVTNIENGTLIAMLSTGLSITVREQNNILSDVSVFLADNYFNKTYGLLGQFNGMDDDDFYPNNDNDTLLSNSSLEEIHKEFGMTCM